MPNSLLEFKCVYSNNLLSFAGLNSPKRDKQAQKFLTNNLIHFSREQNPYKKVLNMTKKIKKNIFVVIIRGQFTKQKYLYILGIMDRSLCRVCMKEIETQTHVLLKRKNLTKVKHIWRASGRSWIGSSDSNGTSNVLAILGFHAH